MGNEGKKNVIFCNEFTVCITIDSAEYNKIVILTLFYVKQMLIR